MKLVYKIAGRSDDPGFAKALRIAETLASSLKHFAYERQMIHPDDWDSFLQKLNETYGFKHKGSPVVWTYTNEYIGGALDFEAMAIRKYNCPFQLARPFLEKVAVENHAECCDSLVAQREQNEKLQRDEHLAKRRRELDELTMLTRTIHLEYSFAKQFLLLLRPLHLRISLIKRVLAEKPAGNQGITAWKKKFEEAVKFDPPFDFKLEAFQAQARRAESSLAEHYVPYRFNLYLNREYVPTQYTASQSQGSDAATTEPIFEFLSRRYAELAGHFAAIKAKLGDTEKPWRTPHVVPTAESLVTAAEAVYATLELLKTQRLQDQQALEQLIQQRLFDPVSPDDMFLKDFAGVHAAFTAGSTPEALITWQGVLEPLQWQI
eukprot:TRINITY_DN7639_c0_g1_i2.p1 TRINITY_DN7639_c0_g1~~TRINITY_DN7639_c0_g1_i2.p1  ORF type:complete len:377 (-),score=88.48 TRINITY_DN7639_c0_g1_i2:268-1398(-)